MMLRSHGNTRAGTNMFYFLLKSQGEAVLDSDAHMFRDYHSLSVLYGGRSIGGPAVAMQKLHEAPRSCS